MLIWEEGTYEAAFARVMTTAVDGTPVELIRVAATESGYDIQDRNIGPRDHSGHVLARGQCASMDESKLKAEAALREVIGRLLGSF